jgi:DNA polymerase-3 subunit gamma/tau
MKALANKYRPTNFTNVVGQEYIRKILINQIESGQYHNGYCFVGPAGCGKTTIARIFANEIDAEVIEIDGASNNGVDNIRDLIEKVKYKPIKAKNKVVIIDEVHMLSTGAFNALLKTLEEPPQHAVFILATTDPQKIPETILSRVQRFDVRKLTSCEIFDQLSYIASEENIAIDDDALDYISKVANGGMRDAISILDTVAAYSIGNDTITGADVERIISKTFYEEVFKVLEDVFKFGQLLPRIEAVEAIHERGKDLKLFVKNILDVIVDIQKGKIAQDYTITSIPSIYYDRMDELSINCDLLDIFKKVNNLYNNIKYEQNPKSIIIGELLLL